MRLVRALGFCVAMSFVLPVAAQAQGEGHASSEDAQAEARREEEARTLFNAGRMAFADGRYDDALRSFQLSHELSGRALLLYNIGTALDRLRRNEEAINAFEQYLEALPDADNRAAVESRLNALREARAREASREAQLREEEERRRELEARLAAHEAESNQQEGGGVATKWWFWTIIGVVVAGGVVATILLTRDPGVEDPLLGTTGQVSSTLMRF